jgi:virginiamycin B lyase
MSPRQSFSRRVVLATPVALALAQIVRAEEASPVATTTPEECLESETFPVPSGDGPHDVAPAADGRIWYTAQRSGALGILDPASGDVEKIPLGAGSAPHGVVTDPNGIAWITDGGLNALVRVDPSDMMPQPFPVPRANANLNTPVVALDGTVYFTGQGGIVGRLNPVSGSMAVIEAPRGTGPYGITMTPAGEIWYASLAGIYLGRIDVQGDTLVATEFDPPTPGAGVRRVWSDSRGVLWISEWNAGQVGRYDPIDGSWMEWKLPGDAPQAYAVFVDERDDIWLSDFGANALVRFDPDSETFASLPLPDRGANIRQLHGRVGEVWGAMSGVDKLIVVRTNCA